MANTHAEHAQQKKMLRGVCTGDSGWRPIDWEGILFVRENVGVIVWHGGKKFSIRRDLDVVGSEATKFEAMREEMQKICSFLLYLGGISVYFSLSFLLPCVFVVALSPLVSLSLCLSVCLSHYFYCPPLFLHLLCLSAFVVSSFCSWDVSMSVSVWV